MTGRQEMSSEPATEQLFDEAVVWYMCLREAKDDADGDRTDDLIVRFEAWKRQSSDNVIAYAEVEFLWGRLALPVKRQVQAQKSHHSVTKQPSRKQSGYLKAVMIAVVAACLVLIVGFGSETYNTVIGRFDENPVQSEHEVLTKMLSDGSVIKLNAESAVLIDLTAKRRVVKLLSGEVWFDVAHDKERPFVVQTDFGDVTALGTEFNVKTDRQKVTISLEEGKVSVNWHVGGALENPAGEAVVTLLPGEATTLLPDGIGDKIRFDPIATTAWRNGKMVFYQTPLSDVIDVINKYHDGHIMALSSEINNMTVSGVFHTNDINQVLEVIEGTLPVHAVKISKYMILLV
ncbi:MULTISPECIES: FecR domain-containing protein [Thalassospira]|uniref:FecR family protein n=1 Tax=Thalassospira TaxID=168934 RepID=UPI0008DD5D67|nr:MULTISPECIES: FecR domain-containing protein [Thalassospira]MAB35091.1 hypothetical protein [Thalassospira sp.]MBA07052.1 hypothetical protein [Thalassospira sp.]MDM7977523.1 FecR domain-containing protein [Thalassospira xiamenensis]OHZ04708.1 hypothetical protein BC440_06545 [Thalassospira sp. MIT1004]HBS25222.1 DUF4974 domain-containing protein [Thalassospira sp.]